MQKIITLILVATLLAGCMSPVGSTNPDSFGLIRQEALTVGPSGYYEHKETGQLLARHKCLVYYDEHRIAVDFTFIDGRLHRALCYKPEGGLDSVVSVGTGEITRYHATGEIAEKHHFKRGVYVKKELFKYGKYDTTEDIGIGNPIPNDGLEAFMLRCETAKKGVFNEKNGRVLAGIIISAVLGLAVSKLLQSLDSGDKSPPQGNSQTTQVGPTPQTTQVGPTPPNNNAWTNPTPLPPPGYYRNSSGEIEPMNPGMAGYYRSNAGNLVPILKPPAVITDRYNHELGIWQTSPISVGNNYLNPDTGLMTLIEIQWPIQ